MITGIAHLAFRITNLERALDFYCGRLGFREAFRLDREGQPSPWIVYLQVAPGQFLELFPGAEKTGSQPDGTFGYNHFSLRVDDMEATLRDLSDRGLPLTGQPSMGLDNNWQYWITDPDGNRIELMQIMPDSPQAAADTHWQDRSGKEVAHGV
jgi:lactoylglutathione lyase